MLGSLSFQGISSINHSLLTNASIGVDRCPKVMLKFYGGKTPQEALKLRPLGKRNLFRRNNMGNLHHRRLHAKLDHYDCVFSHKQERPIEDVETEAQLGADSEGSRRFYCF